MNNKTRKERPVYPALADSVLKSVSIEVVPQVIKDQYVRPDTIRMYVPPEANEESDEEAERERKRKRTKDLYKHKTIKKVVDKVKNETGQVTYQIIWDSGRHGEVEMVPSKGLQDHSDWGLVEAFEYTKAKSQASSIHSTEF